MAEIVNRHNFLDFVYDFYLKMKSKDVNLVYEGEITHQITKAFTSLTESKMLREEEPNVVQKKVFHVMVECLQNISKHASPEEEVNAEKKGKGIFMVSKSDSEYLVTTGNAIPTEKIEGLRLMLANINKLDKDGLKKLYKQQIREGRLSEKGGAGLGFIDIAKKTGRPLEYHFLTVNKDESFFVLTSSISRK